VQQSTDGSASSVTCYDPEIELLKARRKRKLRDGPGERASEASSSGSSSDEILSKPETDTCAVCLETLGSFNPNPKAECSRESKNLSSDESAILVPDACDHAFCFRCIFSWAKISHACPLCKIEFKKFKRFRPMKLIRHKKRKIRLWNRASGYVFPPELPEKEAEEEDMTTCLICNSGECEELLMLCDGCDAPYHTYCLSPALSEVPQGDWFCRDCQDQYSSEDPNGSFVESPQHFSQNDDDTDDEIEDVHESDGDSKHDPNGSFVESPQHQPQNDDDTDDEIGDVYEPHSWIKNGPVENFNHEAKSHDDTTQPDSETTGSEPFRGVVDDSQDSSDDEIEDFRIRKESPSRDRSSSASSSKHDANVLEEFRCTLKSGPQEDHMW